MLLYNFCTLSLPFSCLYHYIVFISFCVFTPQRYFKNFIVCPACNDNKSNSESDSDFVGIVVVLFCDITNIYIYIFLHVLNSLLMET